ncbi:MAG: hypothetical protein Q7S66_01525 [bacterium]|nr:hypothetical protein [bacterium]
MAKIPPHLPAPVCNIDDHKKWLRLKLIIASASFGMLAGLSGAAVMVGWVWPNYGGGDIWLSSAQNRSSVSPNQLDDKVAREINDRIFSVYAGGSPLSGISYLKKTDKLGDAIVIGSDGWLSMFIGRYSGNFKNWVALSNDGSTYEVEKVVFDKFSGVIYLKLLIATTNNNQFKVVSFTDTATLGSTAFVWADGIWSVALIAREIYALVPPHLDTAPVLSFSLSEPVPAGSVAIDLQGKVVGLADSQGRIIPNAYLTRVIPDLLSLNRFTYLSLGVDGWFGAEQPIVVDSQTISGFAVSQVWAAGSPLRKGDIILAINGKPIEESKFLWYNKGTSVKLQILRNGKKIEVESTIFETK